VQREGRENVDDAWVPCIGTWLLGFEEEEIESLLEFIAPSEGKCFCKLE
jgi:hypothetical protein